MGNVFFKKLSQINALQIVIFLLVLNILYAHYYYLFLRTYYLRLHDKPIPMPGIKIKNNYFVNFVKYFALVQVA